MSAPRVGVVSLIVVILVAGIGSGLFVYAESFRGRILPGVFVGTVPVGGLDAATAKRRLASRLTAMSDTGIQVSLEGAPTQSTFTIDPTITTDEAKIDLLTVDLDQTVAHLLQYGRSRFILEALLAPVVTAIEHPHISLSQVTVNPQLRMVLAAHVHEKQQPPEDARVIVRSFKPFAYDIEPAHGGVLYQYDQAIADMVSAWSRLETPRVTLVRRFLEPGVQANDLQPILPRLPIIFGQDGLTLTYTDPYTDKPYEWPITSSQLADWLVAERVPSGEIAFGLNKAAFLDAAINRILPTIETPAQDAKFRADDTGRVIEFQGSHPGITLDPDATFAAADGAFRERTFHDEGVVNHVPVVTKTQEPNITTAQANNLGIAEILGVGISDFSGSATNRIKNIRNAVQKLNGILIKPNEDFSALNYLRPFTDDAGYLPELVIKGDQITPEIGGGLCQIGTTLFRMAMNSGMPITERRNHSLVVHYYGDYRNGNPGTDATIYDPSPDFRFKNDTGHALLLETSMDVKKSQLVFTLWGTSDGRKGYYGAPEVKRWIPYDDGTKTIETNTLPPGEKKCQNPFRGAEASFTYTRELPDGTKQDQVFDSYYRPLQQVCLVGAATSTEAIPGAATLPLSPD